MSRVLVFAEAPKTKAVGKHLPGVVELTSPMNTVDGVRVRKGTLICCAVFGNSSVPGRVGERYSCEMYVTDAATDWVLEERTGQRLPPSLVRPGWKNQHSKTGYGSYEEAYSRQLKILHQAAKKGYSPQFGILRRCHGIVVG